MNKNTGTNEEHIIKLLWSIHEQSESIHVPQWLEIVIEIVKSDLKYSEYEYHLTKDQLKSYLFGLDSGFIDKSADWIPWVIANYIFAKSTKSLNKSLEEIV